MSVRSERGPIASLTIKQVLNVMKKLAANSKQDTVSLNDLVWHFVNAGSKRRKIEEEASGTPFEDRQKAFRAKIVELLRHGAAEGACYMIKPNIYRLDDQTQNQGAFANGEKNSSSDAGPSKFGDLEAILEAHLNAQFPLESGLAFFQKKKAKVCKQTKLIIDRDENQTIDSIVSIASIDVQHDEKNFGVAKKKVDRRKTQNKGRESVDQENETKGRSDEPKRAKNRKSVARKTTKNLPKFDGKSSNHVDLNSTASNEHFQV
uniref:H15 domain-containing protein n=1 Tax=Romanomermis culicivorax TaxID=13658 RepID=A0A915JJF2_ROMCU